MTKLDFLDRLLGHDRWTTQQLLLLAQDLPSSDFDTDFGIGHGTLRATFLHIIRNVEVWSSLLLDETPEDASGESVSDLLERLAKAADRLSRAADRIREAEAWDEIWNDPLDGLEKTRGGALAHVLTHSMHHRAQILYMLRRCGIQNLPEGDVLSWEAANASQTR